MLAGGYTRYNGARSQINKDNTNGTVSASELDGERRVVILTEGRILR